MSALLIIDVQRDFIWGGALAVSGTAFYSPMYTAIQQLQHMPFTLQIATQDWHPPGHISFASTHNATPFSKQIIDGYEQVMWPDHCVQGSRGAQLSGYVLQDKLTAIVTKGTHPRVDSYSAFGDAHTPRGAKKEHEDTGLLNLLHQHAIKHVVLCGIATDYCVKATALDAAAYGFCVTVVMSACRGVDPVSTQRALHLLSNTPHIYVVDTPADVAAEFKSKASSC